MKLSELQPHFVEFQGGSWHDVEDIGQADGITFLCPVCLGQNGEHAILCWSFKIPQTVLPRPGRWVFVGTGYADLTLAAVCSSLRRFVGGQGQLNAIRSSAVRLSGTGKCGALFQIIKGEILVHASLRRQFDTAACA
jgi:hypothetical protein